MEKQTIDLSNKDVGGLFIKHRKEFEFFVKKLYPNENVRNRINLENCNLGILDFDNFFDFLKCFENKDLLKLKGNNFEYMFLELFQNAFKEYMDLKQIEEKENFQFFKSDHPNTNYNEFIHFSVVLGAYFTKKVEKLNTLNLENCNIQMQECNVPVVFQKMLIEHLECAAIWF